MQRNLYRICFYGAGVTAPRTDTNFAPIDLLEKVSGKLNFICGSSDDLITLKDRLEIKKRFKQKHKKLNQALTDIQKINTISLNNFLKIQIHD